VTATVKLTKSPACIQKDEKPFTGTSDLVAVVGNQVFGLRNAPFLSASENTLSFLLPTGLLQNSRRVTIKRLLWGSAFEAGKDLDEDTFRTTPVVGQATVVFQDKEKLEIALTGTGLKGLQPLLPLSAKLDPQRDSGAILSVRKTDLKNVKQMVLTDPAGELFLVTLPADATPQTPQLDSVTKGQPTITVPAFGPDLHTLNDVQYEGKSLAFTVDADGKSVTITASAVTAISGTKTLTFLFKGDKKIQYAINVVDSAVLVRQPAPQPSK
jgi:hypothetical protein